MGMLPYPLLAQDFQKLLFLLAFPVNQAVLCLQGHQGDQEDPKKGQKSLVRTKKKNMNLNASHSKGKARKPVGTLAPSEPAGPGPPLAPGGPGGPWAPRSPGIPFSPCNKERCYLLLSGSYYVNSFM